MPNVLLSCPILQVKIYSEIKDYASFHSEINGDVRLRCCGWRVREVTRYKESERDVVHRNLNIFEDSLK